MDKLEFFHAGTKETGCVKVLENKNEKRKFHLLNFLKICEE